MISLFSFNLKSVISSQRKESCVVVALHNMAVWTCLLYFLFVGVCSDCGGHYWKIGNFRALHDAPVHSAV